MRTIATILALIAVALAAAAFAQAPAFCLATDPADPDCDIADFDAVGITTRTSMHEAAPPSKNAIGANGTEGGEQERASTGGVDSIEVGVDSIEVNAHLHNAKDSPKPAGDGRPVHTALVANVNNPGASARHKNAASVIAVGNAKDPPKPADKGRLVHIALVANVNNPGASARDKDEASVGHNGQRRGT